MLLEKFYFAAWKVVAGLEQAARSPVVPWCCSRPRGVRTAAEKKKREDGRWDPQMMASQAFEMQKRAHGWVQHRVEPVVGGAALRQLGGRSRGDCTHGLLDVAISRSTGQG